MSAPQHGNLCQSNLVLIWPRHYKNRRHQQPTTLLQYPRFANILPSQSQREDVVVRPKSSIGKLLQNVKQHSQNKERDKCKQWWMGNLNLQMPSMQGLKGRWQAQPPGDCVATGKKNLINLSWKEWRIRGSIKKICGNATKAKSSFLNGRFIYLLCMYDRLFCQFDYLPK